MQINRTLNDNETSVAQIEERRMLVALNGLTLAKRPSESHDIDSLRDVIKALARDSARFDHAEDKQGSTL